jgi:formate dehydrogenase major subunit
MKSPLSRWIRKTSPAPVSPRAAATQPFSANTVAKSPRTRGAVAVPSVCPYCAVGCGQMIYTKGGKIVDIEGNPESPINEGTLCPKGANTFQLTVNPHRITTVLYRAPYSERWEERPLEWALDRVAERVKATRDETFAETRDDLTVNHTTAIASLGGATMDIEENYLIKKLLGGGLGVVQIENQARI